MNIARSSGEFFISVVTVLVLTLSSMSLNRSKPSALYSTSGSRWPERPQVDALLQVVHVEQVVLPAAVDDLEHDGALHAAHLLLADEALALVVLLERVVDRQVDDLVDGGALHVDVRLLELPGSRPA